MGGGGAVILPRVTIGKMAMIGVGAVVTKEVPSHGGCHGITSNTNPSIYLIS